MASLDAIGANPRAVPKLRERKHGAAVPLTELDKQLLNQMQGAFPLEPRPFKSVAEDLKVDEETRPRAASRS